jgi:uncharacterized protein YgiM (DUF1202 family)
MAGFEGTESVRHFQKPKQSQNYSNGRKHKQFRMNVQKTVAVAGLVLCVTSSTAFAAEPTPAASVALPATTATPVAPPATPSKIKATKKRFLLTHSSSVYEQPDKASAVVGHVRHGTHVNVTGVTGDWLQVKLSSGKVGFIPSSAAE